MTRVSSPIVRGLGGINGTTPGVELGPEIAGGVGEPDCGTCAPGTTTPLDVERAQAARGTHAAGDKAARAQLENLFGTEGAQLMTLLGLNKEEMQGILKELGYNDKNPTEALKKFQADVGLPVTGEFDIAALAEMFMAKANSDRRSRSSGGGGAARHGSVGGGQSNGGGYAAQNAGGGNNGGSADVNRPLQQTAPVDTSNWRPGQGDVTPEQLRQIVPTLSAQKAQEVAPHINRAMAEAGIDSPARKAAFIAQLAHESGGFNYNEEIASGAAYEGRRDLGNTQPGDGQRFKGRGYIQLTGRANYEAAGKALGLDLVNNPELAARPENAARVAAWYWNSRGLNSLADQGNFDAITKRINGGYNGKADRDQYHARAQQVLANSTGLPSTGQFTTPAGTAPAGEATVAGVDTNHPHLRALGTGPLQNGPTNYCVRTTLDNMKRLGVPQPAATGNDVGNNPRGAMVQMMNDFGWKSLALPGAQQQTLNSPYGTVRANVIPAAEYERMARDGQIPSGAVVFQTRHNSWNSTNDGSSGFDMGIARNGGRNLFNFKDMGGPMVYGDTRSVVVLVPGDAVR